MFKLKVNEPEIIAQRLAEVIADINTVATKLELANFLGEEVHKLLKSKRKQVVKAVEDYAIAGVVAVEKQGIGKFKKPTLIDFVVIKILQYVYGVVVANLGVATNQSASQRVRPGEYPEGNIPYMRGGPIFAYIDHPNPHVGEAVVITGLGASAGQVKYFNEPVVVAESLIMDPVPGISHGRFLYHSLKWREFYFNRYCGGTGIPSIPKSVVLPQSVALPEYEVQEDIAFVLDTLTIELAKLDDQIMKAQRAYIIYQVHKTFELKHTNDEIKKRLVTLKDSFSTVCHELDLIEINYDKDEVINSVNTYLNAEHSELKYADVRFLDFIQYVCGDALVRIGDICEEIQSGRLVADQQPNGEVPLVSSGLNPVKFITPPKNRPAHPRDVVVIAVAGAGAGQTTHWHGPVIVSDSFAAEGKEGISLTKYLYYAARDAEFELREKAAGTGIPGISKSKIRNHKIYLPPLEKQRQLVSEFDHFECWIDSLKSKRKALQKIYDYSLVQTFSGTYTNQNSDY